MSTTLAEPLSRAVRRPEAAPPLCQNRPVSAERDAEAVLRLAGGETAALRELYDRHGRLVYGMALRLTGDRQLAEEATQDAFVALWRRASTFDPERARPTTWLFAIARNRAVDLVRRRARAAEPHADLEPRGEAPDPAELVAVGDEAERLAGLLADLPDPQREVLQLAFFDGLSHAEIAERTGLPLGTVKGRIRLALERLRAQLAEAELEVRP